MPDTPPPTVAVESETKPWNVEIKVYYLAPSSGGPGSSFDWNLNLN